MENPNTPTPSGTPPEAADAGSIEKAELQILSMIENSYKPRDQRDLAEWIVGLLRPDQVEWLASDYDEWANEGQEGGANE